MPSEWLPQLAAIGMAANVGLQPQVALYAPRPAGRRFGHLRGVSGQRPSPQCSPPPGARLEAVDRSARLVRATARPATLGRVRPPLVSTARTASNRMNHSGDGPVRLKVFSIPGVAAKSPVGSRSCRRRTCQESSPMASGRHDGAQVCAAHWAVHGRACFAARWPRIAAPRTPAGPQSTPRRRPGPCSSRRRGSAPPLPVRPGRPARPQSPPSRRDQMCCRYRFRLIVRAQPAATTRGGRKDRASEAPGLAHLHPAGRLVLHVAELGAEGHLAAPLAQRPPSTSSLLARAVGVGRVEEKGHPVVQSAV
jgi:hypothetical protein